MKNTVASAEIFKVLENASVVLLVTHESPDGDALASLSIWYEFLTSGGREVFTFCKDAPEDGFLFLPYREQIHTGAPNIPFGRLDAVVAVDCASLKRTGLEDELLALRCPIINIDHHASNNFFGAFNIVDAEAVSTTEILYDMFKRQQKPISRSMATGVLTGILTDSGNFAYAATQARTFDIAGEMLMRGASVRDIINHTHKNKRLSALKVWGLALSRLRHNQTYDIAYTVLTKQDWQAAGATKEDLEGLSNFLNTLKDATIVMVLYELADGRIKGSLRATRDGVDVAKLAQTLGGGGHAKAAGFEVEGKLVQFNDSWRIE